MRRYNPFGGYTLLLAISLPLVGCADRETAEESRANPLATYEMLAPGEVNHLTLERIGSVTLGSSVDSSVFRITSFSPREDRFYILDGLAKAVRVFDRSGTFVGQLGREGRGPGEFRDPFDFSVAGERVLVIDPTMGPVISSFGLRDGRVETLRTDLPGAPTAIESEGNLLYILTSMVANPDRKGSDLLSILNPAGKPVGRGCPLDPRYVRSHKNEGFISHNQFGDIAVRDGRVYCIQTISPVVQVMDTTGRTLRHIQIAPPFYRAPEDRKMSFNQKDIFEWLSTWTTHTKIYALEGGFASIYSTFDPERQQQQYALFLCNDNEGRLRCGMAEHLGKPIAMPDGQTVLLEEEFGPNEPMRVGIFRITGLEETRS